MDNLLLNDNEIAHLGAIIEKLHANAVEKGFWCADADHLLKPDTFARRLMLIITEMGEAYEGMRRRKKSDHLEDCAMVDEEIWDVFIRLCDLIGGYGVPLDILRRKVEFNRGREYKHGKEF
jgi:NTP pyrophosphatase (non-canonical NTP hydrolase)